MTKKPTTQKELYTKSRILIVLFIIGLVLSGITAFPIETQLSYGMKHIDWLPNIVSDWLHLVYEAISTTNQYYPFISYGTDWLAFAHIVIAVNFIGPLMNPIKNRWVIEFGMIACIMVIPFAIIAGEIRQIPFFWRLIDCSFGVIGFLILYQCHCFIRQLEKLTALKNASRGLGIAVY